MHSLAGGAFGAQAVQLKKMSNSDKLAMPLFAARVSTEHKELAKRAQILKKDQWIAAIGRHFGPRYIAIVETLAEMVETNVLHGGQQIPTQRELARMLSLTPGTTARAYAIAAQRGLIVGEAGRGTYVRRDAAIPRLPRDAEYLEASNSNGFETRLPIQESTSLGDLAIPNVIAENLREGLQKVLRNAAESLDFDLGRYHPYSTQIPLKFRQVGARWLLRLGMSVDPDQVVLTSNAHGALYLILFSENLRRLPVMTSVLTYAGLRNIALAHNHPVVPIAVDSSGPTPESIELGFKHGGGRVLYLQTNLHNPTCISMSLVRRQEIAEIARKLDLIVIEDNAAALALSDEIPPIATLAPERTFLISSCAKSVGPAVNLGIVAVPKGWASQLNVAIKTHHIYASMFNVEVVRLLLETGILDRICESSRIIVRRRAILAQRILDPFVLRTHPDSWFAWLELPNSWTSDSFTTAARMQGIAVGAVQNFGLDGVVPDQNGVRISLSSPATDQALVDYTQRIRELLIPSQHENRSII